MPAEGESLLSASPGEDLFEGGKKKKEDKKKEEERSEASSTPISSRWKDSASQGGGSDYETPKVRIYYADWLRCLAIQLVIFIHCLVNAADAAEFNPEENPGMQQKKDGIVKSLVQIGIPMFFYISGMGTTFTNTEREFAFLRFLWGKILRIAIPFGIAIFVFLMPRLYLGQTYEDWTRWENENGDKIIISEYWDYQTKTLPTVLAKLSWLWYLPALFLDFMITYPLVAWTVRRARGVPWAARSDLLIIFMQIVVLVLWTYPCFYLDTYYDRGTTKLLPSTITLACVFVGFYVWQCFIPLADNFAMTMKLIGPIASICLNVWKDQQPNEPLHHVLMMINYDACFFAQGVVDQLYFKQQMRCRKRMGRTLFAPFSIVFGALLYALSSPQNYKETGFLFFYPLYSDYSIQCLYTSGTWLWLYVIAWTMERVGNSKFNKNVYKFFVGNSLYAYLSHYFWIILIAVGIIRPYKMDFIPGLVVMLLLVNLLIAVTYAPFILVYEFFFPPPEDRNGGNNGDKPDDKKKKKGE